MKRRSILNKLTMMNMLVSGAALLLACAGFFAYDQITFRKNLVRTLSAQAQIIASNSVSALVFNDPQAAANTIAGLKNSPNIASAGIITANQHPFARYTREPGDDIINIPVLPENQLEGHWFRNTHVILVRKIMSERTLLGFVYLRVDLREIDQRLRKYALITAAVLLVSLLFAFLVSSAFRKSVAQPIVALSEMAQRVTRERDYSLRMPPSSEGNEISALIDSFNAMLSEIELRDTELQKAHDELEQRVAERTRELVVANRELEAFSYSVSHDLRGPLDTLNGFSYVLSRQYAETIGPEGQEIIDQIRACVKRMRQLIDDLLNLSRVSGTTMHKESVDLSAIARSIIEELRRSEPDRQVNFVVNPSTRVVGDVHLLRIVLDNLLRNSWKYTSHHARARIEFGARVQDGRTMYFVGDDGAGFDNRAIGRLFQPFQRLHSSAEFSGNGIGLATVQRIIHRHGGEVWAEGAVEQGATFYFTLA
ncbi:MAG TPA: ATP-binding protein [Terriglobales bacterium]|nr:ATP-binding protein [Terriglobales bacterium]